MAVISLCGALITAYVVPFIRSKIEANRLNALIDYVRVGVRCAEQIYSHDEWIKKKRYVMETVKDYINLYMHIEITDEQLDTIVEGIVNEVKHP